MIDDSVTIGIAGDYVDGAKLNTLDIALFNNIIHLVTELSEPVLTKPTEEASARKRGPKFAKACFEHVRARLDDGAIKVLGAMLAATRSVEKKVKTEDSVPLSLNSVYEEVIKSKEGRNITFDCVRASLVQLSCPPFVESIVLKRYGRDAYSMFRLLSKSGCLLETDKIADTTFVEKDMPKILYKLWKDDYLHMELLNVPQVKRVNRVRKVRLLLESSQMKLDDAIMLFQDF
ncbi:hypothetical protein REPUB_Repub07fG0135400 [Reevesia pubescens]